MVVDWKRWRFFSCWFVHRSLPKFCKIYSLLPSLGWWCCCCWSCNFQFGVSVCILFVVKMKLEYFSYENKFKLCCCCCCCCRMRKYFKIKDENLFRFFLLFLEIMCWLVYCWKINWIFNLNICFWFSTWVLLLQNYLTIFVL